MDIDLLNKYHKQKLLKKRQHDVYDLIIWNYSEQVQYNRLWDDILLQCRGLVTDLSGNIIARPFQKFFNIEENMHKPTEQFEIYEKMDGSLGILFHYNNKWIISSRGSFTSEQAIEAQKILDEKYQNYHEKLNSNYTYLFEIIFPENKIIVDYFGKRELIFLTAIETHTGVEKFHESVTSIYECNFPIVKIYKTDEISQLKKLNIPNQEGYVVRFDNGERIKIKFEDYLKLHKAFTKLTNGSIFKWFSENGDINSIIEHIPDEFMKDVELIWNDFQKEYDDILYDVKTEFTNLMIYIPLTKKEFAIACSKHKYKNILLRLYDNKGEEDARIRSLILNQFKPIENKVINMNATFNKYSKKKNYKLIMVLCNKTYSLPQYEEDCIYIDKRNYNNINFIRKTLQSNNVIMEIKEKIPNIEKIRESNDVIIYFFDIQSDNRMYLALKKQYSYELEQEKDLKKGKIYLNRINESIGLQIDETLPKAIICDIDGTLAYNHHRNPFDWAQLLLDNVNHAVNEVLNVFREKGIHIIIVTARSYEAKEGTLKWLEKHNISFTEFFIRKDHDLRQDCIIKEEFWRDIIKRYSILFLLDDRDQVVNHGRKLGLNVFQVNDGNF